MTDAVNGKTPPAASPPMASAEAPELVFDAQQRPVGLRVGGQLVPITPPASLLPTPPTDEALLRVLAAGRQGLHALQLARAQGQLAIDLDYADQALGGMRGSWSKFQQNLAHNRTRAEMLDAVRDGIHEAVNRTTAMIQEALATAMDEQHAAMEFELHQQQLQMQAAEWQVEAQYGPEAQAHRRALELAAQEQAHEEVLAVLQAGQQLPDLLAQLQRQYATNPTTVASVLMSSLQLAMSQYQQLIATTDAAARKQLAEQLKPFLMMVMQQTIAAVKTSGDAPGGG
jgi:hypothetical protein